MLLYFQSLQYHFLFVLVKAVKFILRVGYKIKENYSFWLLCSKTFFEFLILVGAETKAVVFFICGTSKHLNLRLW